MICVRLATPRFIAGVNELCPTVFELWTNTSTDILKVQRTCLWAGLDIGSVMDFNAMLYRGSDSLFFGVYGFDRYGTSNGQNYTQWLDWEKYDIQIVPGDSVVLGANAIQFAANQVFPASNPSGAAAQAFVYLQATT